MVRLSLLSIAALFAAPAFAVPGRHRLVPPDDDGIIPLHGQALRPKVHRKTISLQRAEELGPARNQNDSLSFQQLIDHKNPKLGTFSQRYWISTQYYKPGGPIVLMTPGEIAADGYVTYLTDTRITGVMAKNFSGAAIVFEHRYWGKSSPFANLTTKNLQYQTTDNAIEDLKYFVENVKLPGIPAEYQGNKKTPWIMVGGSYPASLTLWTKKRYPDLFYIGWATSGPVQAINDFWQYFKPVEDHGLPANCSASLRTVLSHVDGVLQHGSAAQKKALRKLFDLEDIEYDDDFAQALEVGPWSWQSVQPLSGYADSFQMCDAMNVVNGTIKAGKNGAPLKQALAGYAKWIKSYIPGYCAGYGFKNDTAKCFGTHDKTLPLFTDLSVDNNYDRQWQYLCCSVYGWWQTGAPNSTSTIVSRLVDIDYWERQCSMMFPAERGAATPKFRPAYVNAYLSGWNLHDLPHTVVVNGEADPWRSASLASDYRPGGAVKSSAMMPQFVIKGGVHCWDTHTDGWVNPNIRKVTDGGFSYVKRWLDEYKPQGALPHEPHHPRHPPKPIGHKPHRPHAPHDPYGSNGPH